MISTAFAGWQKVLFFCILMFQVHGSGLVSAQANGKPRLKANRHKTFTYQGKERIEESYDYGVYTIRIKKGRVDTVFVHQGNELITTFLARYSDIVSPAINYITDGVRYTDTLDLKSSMRKIKYNYYGGFNSAQLFSTYNHSNGDQVYYRLGGADSLYVYRFGDGKTKKKIWKDGVEYARKEFNKEGKLTYERHLSQETIYDPPGQLHSQHYDTVMAGRTVECRKTWYDNGAPETVTYDYMGEPCHIWSYYDRSGKLARIVRKTPLDKLPMEVREPPFMYAEPVPAMFHSVSTEEAYKIDLASYLNMEMNKILCASRKELKGSYVVRTNLSEAGKMSFVSAKGYNAEAITPELQQMISQMQSWKPAKENAQPRALLLDLRFTINEVPAK